MKLGLPDFTIAQLHPRHTFEFPPSAPSVNSTQPRDVPDTATDPYGLDIGDLPDYLEIHRGRASLFSLVPHPIQARKYLRGVAAA